VIHLDTSTLIDALTGSRRSGQALRQFLDRGERLGWSCLALYEWRRGRRTESELAHLEALLPDTQAVPFGPREAVVAAELYRVMPRARHREFDLAVAACALVNGAALWTLNARDFSDIPGLEVIAP
jgi:predicted nucleic acid-binding protein